MAASGRHGCAGGRVPPQAHGLRSARCVPRAGAVTPAPGAGKGSEAGPRPSRHGRVPGQRSDVGTGCGTVEFDGAPRETRTPDPLITNQLLYQLSYRGTGSGYSRRGRARKRGGGRPRISPVGRLRAWRSSCGRWLAEREGFEPSRRFPAYTLSRRAPSTTRPPLRAGDINHVRRQRASPAAAIPSRRLTDESLWMDRVSRWRRCASLRPQSRSSECSWRQDPSMCLPKSGTGGHHAGIRPRRSADGCLGDWLPGVAGCDSGRTRRWQWSLSAGPRKGRSHHEVV